MLQVQWKGIFRGTIEIVLKMYGSVFHHELVHETGF